VDVPDRRQQAQRDGHVHPRDGHQQLRRRQLAGAPAPPLVQRPTLPLQRVVHGQRAVENHALRLRERLLRQPLPAPRIEQLGMGTAQQPLVQDPAHRVLHGHQPLAQKLPVGRQLPQLPRRLVRHRHLGHEIGPQ